MNKHLMGLPSPSWFPQKEPRRGPVPPSGPLLYVGRDVGHYTFLDGRLELSRIGGASNPVSATCRTALLGTP